jgi:hypothetical protein
MTATGQQLAELSIPELLAGTGARFVRGWVTALDVRAKTVRIDDDRVLPYDTLVHGLGSAADTAAVPGVDDYAYTLNSAQDAEVLGGRLNQVGHGTVVVVGSGLTGVESAAVRQAAHRAREHVQARRPRFTAQRSRQREVAERFFSAATGGVVNALMELPAPDVTLWTHGGGKVRQALRPIVGATTVASWFAAIGTVTYHGVAPADMRAELVEINGGPGMLLRGPTGPSRRSPSTSTPTAGSRLSTTWPTPTRSARSPTARPTTSGRAEVSPSGRAAGWPTRQ